MLSDEAIDKLTDVLVKQINKTNLNILKRIVNNIKKLGELTPSDAQQLAQILKYGADYNKIKKELENLLNMNEKSIDEIFKAVAKKDYQFAQQFYAYRNIPYIPFEQNLELKRQLDIIKQITLNTYRNIANTTVIGYNIKDVNGEIIFRDVSSAYQDVIDRAILGITQGKTTFDEELRNIIKELGTSGLKSVDYQSGRTQRLDSAVRMNIKRGISDMHNRLQDVIGEQIGSDGYEISVHLNPAQDHQYAQGKQFSKEQYELLQTTGYATTYDNKKVTLHRHTETFRPISEYNCYHYIFAIVLGISKQVYSNEELKEIINKNNEGFDFDGKHYTMYEGTQLQRRLELGIRKAKDCQVLYRETNDRENAEKYQKRIDDLSYKYNQLCKISGLPSFNERMSVSKYRKIKIKGVKND